MADAEIEAAPTGPFGEGAAERTAAEAPSPSYSRDTEQHFFRQRRADTEAADEGTAEHAPMIDRPAPER
jgi:hypothetical protein